MTDLHVFWLIIFFLYAGLDAAAQNTGPASALTEESHADTLSQNNLKTHISASNLNGHIELTTLKILLTTFPSKIDVTNDNSTSIVSEQKKSDANRQLFEDFLENPPYSEYSSEYESNEDTSKSESSLSSSDNSEEDEEAAAKGSTDGLKSNDVINGSETSGNFVAINGEHGSEIPPANKAPLSGNYNFKNDKEDKGDVPIATDEDASTMEMDDQESLFSETGEESDESLFELNDPTEENWFGNISYEEDESTYSPRETISELEEIRKLLTKTATERPSDFPKYSNEIGDIENNEESDSKSAEEAENNDNSDSFSVSEEWFEFSTMSAVNLESDSIESTEATSTGSESNKEHQSTIFESEENIAATEISASALASKIIEEESVEKHTSEDISSYESILSPTIMPASNEEATTTDDSNHKVNTDGDFVIVVEDIYSSSESDEYDPEIYFDNLSTENPSEDTISEIQEDFIEETRIVPVNANLGSDSIDSTGATSTESESNKEQHFTTFESEENIATTEIASEIIDQETAEKHTSEDISSYESILSPTIMPARNEEAITSDDSNHKVNTDGDFGIVVEDIYSSSESDEYDPEIYFDSLSTENPSEDNISETQEDRIEKTRIVPVNANLGSDSIESTEATSTGSESNKEHPSTTFESEENIATTEIASKIINQQTAEKYTSEDISSYESILSPTIMPARNEEAITSDDPNHKGDIIIVVDNVYSSSESDEDDPETYFDNSSTESPSEDNISEIQEDRIEKITTVPVNANEDVSEQVSGSITEVTMVQENEEFSTTAGSDDQTEENVTTEDISNYAEGNEDDSDSTSYSTEATSEEISCEINGNCIKENSIKIDRIEKVEESVEANTQKIQSNKEDDANKSPVIESTEESSASATEKHSFSDSIEEYLTGEDNTTDDNSDSTEEENSPETVQVNIATEKETILEATTLSKNMEFDDIAAITTSEVNYSSGDNEEVTATESDSLIGNLLKSIVEEMILASNFSSKLNESIEESTEDNPKISDKLITWTLMNDSTTEATEPKKELLSSQENEVQVTDYPFFASMELLEEVLAAENIPADSEDENNDETNKTTNISDGDLYAPTTETETLTPTRVPKNLADVDERHQDGVIVTGTSLETTTEKINKTISDFETPEKFAVVFSEEFPSESSESTNISPEETLVAESGEYIESSIIDEREKLPVEYISYSVESDEYVTKVNTSNNEGISEMLPSDENNPEKNISGEEDGTTQGEIESITDSVAENIDTSYMQPDSIESEEYTESFFVTISEELASDSLDSTKISSEETESNESVTYERILKVFPSGTDTSFLEEDIVVLTETEPNQEDVKSTTILEQTTKVTTGRRTQFKDFAEIVISSEELSSEQSDMGAPDVALTNNYTDNFLNYTEVEAPGENATLSEVLNFIYQRFLASILESELEIAENSTSAAVQDEAGESTEATHEMETNVANSDKSEVAPEEIYEDESIYSDESNTEEDSNTSDEHNEESDLISNEGEEEEKVTNINQSEEAHNEGSHVQEHDLSEDQSNDIILDGEHVPYIIGKALENDVNISIKIIAEDVTFYVPPYAYLLEDLDNLVLNITWSSPNKILNNSLSLTLTQISKYYVINGVQLNIVRDNEMLVWKKNVVILPKKVDEAGKYDCVVEFEDGVVVSISNIDFLKSNVKGNIKNGSDVHSSTTNASGRRILHIEIASGCMGVALILSAILYVVIKKSRKRSLKSKGASVQHVAA